MVIGIFVASLLLSLWLVSILPPDKIVQYIIAAVAYMWYTSVFTYYVEGAVPEFVLGLLFTHIVALIAAVIPAGFFWFIAILLVVGYFI